MDFWTIAAEIKDDDPEEDSANDLNTALPEDLEHIPLSTYKRYSESEMITRSVEFYMDMNNRRTVRHYSSEPVPKDVIENIIRTAGKLLDNSIYFSPLKSCFSSH